MHIKSLRLRAFKRFSDLEITDLPAEARLVVLAGPNGSGKSGIFDGINSWRRLRGGWGFDGSGDYFPKIGDFAVQNHELIDLTFHEDLPPTPEEVRTRIWVRSAYRHDPDFRTRSIERMEAIMSERGRDTMIQAETAVARNYQRLVATTISSVYDRNDDSLTVRELRERLLGRLGRAMQSVFGDLTLEGPGDPLADGTFFFTKGRAENFRYLNLSAGEKAAFDLLLDLVLRVEDCDDTVLCIDEPELHVGTRTQALLLRALVDLLPASSQLWLATHSIGMMRAAKDMALEREGDVAFLDLADHDFDEPVTLRPVPPDRKFWKKVLAVALDDMADLVAPSQVVLCEGQPGNDWDARCYQAIFSPEFPDTEFVSVGNSHDVERDRLQYGHTFTAVSPGTSVSRVRDRDEMNDLEVGDLLKAGVRVLSRRHLESFLLADDALEALAAHHSKPELGAELIACREQGVSDAIARGKSPDDMKSAAGAVYNCAKNLFALVSQGGNAHAFLAHAVAPLLKPGMPSYEALKADVFGLPPEDPR